METPRATSERPVPHSAAAAEVDERRLNLALAFVVGLAGGVGWSLLVVWLTRGS